MFVYLFVCLFVFGCLSTFNGKNKPINKEQVLAITMQFTFCTLPKNGYERIFSILFINYLFSYLLHYLLYHKLYHLFYYVLFIILFFILLITLYLSNYSLYYLLHYLIYYLLYHVLCYSLYYLLYNNEHYKTSSRRIHNSAGPTENYFMQISKYQNQIN